MKILIYGAGVVGCTYGWQLSKAGCDVAVLVRKEQKELVQKDGIRIICSDFREKTRKDTDIIFKPTVIDELSSNNDFEYILSPPINCNYQLYYQVFQTQQEKQMLYFSKITGMFLLK